MRLKYVLPLDAGRERTVTPWGTFGFNGDETKLEDENERAGGFDVSVSGARRGDSK